MTETTSVTRSQYALLAGLALCAAAATAWLSATHEAFFRPYFGRVPPLLAIGIATALGVVSLIDLQSRRGLSIYSRESFARSAVIVTILAIPFAIAVVSVDLALGYPEDINVPFPVSLLFYPVMAYVVETIFHAFPLALLLAIVGRSSEMVGGDRRFWPCIASIALLEPAFQLGIAEWPLSPANVYTGCHVYAFGLVQLAVFRRYDFVSMMLLRLAYYLLWHVVWGHLRL